MKTRRNKWFSLFLLGWIIPLLAWGQAPHKSPVSSSQRTEVDSIRQSTHLVPRAVPPHVSKRPSIQRTKMPASVPPARSILVFFSAVLGALLFMSLFTFAQYLLNRDAPYGWYALYLTLLAVWLWQAISSWFRIDPRLPDHTVSLSFVLMLGSGMMLSYVRFISYLLEIAQKYPQLERWFRWFFAYLAISILVSLVSLLVWNSLWLYTITRIFCYVCMLMIMAQLVRIRHPLKRYVLTGSILILIGAFTSALLTYTSIASNDRLSHTPYFYVAVGILLEILCFSLALGRRFQLNQEEKNQAQYQLIQQLEENGQLQQTYTLELERQLLRREADVLTKAHELEEQRMSQLRSDFERRVSEAEMVALRSQMNPHFIFNCLNSIKLYAIENDSEKASEYLTKFSRLIRLVLENSRIELVSLQNELEALQLYIELEAMRFKHKLRFSIQVEAGIDQRFICIPPLLLQPYVENAIWHGLMHKPEGGTVRIEVSQPQDNLLHIEITDDGIGRLRAAELKSKSAGKHKSFGMQVTADRIRMINQLYNIHTQAQIVDLVDSYGEACGTRVTLQIPV